MNLNLFFRWTGLFILVVAAGVLANSVRSLHEAGLWNHFQTVLFDFSASLPMDGPTGSVLAGMFGYQDTPTVSVVTAYVVYLAVTLAIFFMPASRQSLVKTPSVSHS
jgi:high-affinity iron transporter